MRENVPAGIEASAFELAPDGLVSLFILTLQSGPIFRITGQKQVTWQGNVYESIPCVLGEVQIEADGKANRPTFSFANPEGIFSAAVANGLLDNATLTHLRLLRSDLDQNLDFALVERLRVSQVVSVTKGAVVVQLRDVHDGAAFILPARAYYPPEFPHVKI